MSNGKFLAGLVVGVAAGIAAKYAYDNKEELMDIAIDNYYIAKDELCTFAQHSLEKAEKLSKQAKASADVALNTAKERIDDVANYADEQIDDLKDMVQEAKEETKKENLDDFELKFDEELL